MEEPTRATTCDRCGEPFNTSGVHPSRYCSIACEEGRSALPIDDPSSEGYHFHLQGEPQSLVGKAILATGLKRTCYAPTWHKKPHRYSSQQIVDHDTESEILVLRDDVFLGKVVDFGADGYTIEHENMETGEITKRVVSESVVLDQIRHDRWWVDG